MAPATAWSGARKLLRNLRDVMAAPAEPQARLDQVVKLIAADMVAEVCSLYIRRAGDVLELFATEGLNPDAVHRTRLRVGEGVVGEVAAYARPVALADVQSHPAFALRPETGEEIYQSLMGVPILHTGRVAGVLVVQNRTRRHYDDEEVETLQTIAMVLAELVTSGDVVDPAELLPADGIAVLPLRLDGICFNAGMAMGQVALHQPRIPIRRLLADDPEAEMARLDEALAGMYSALDDLMASPLVDGGGEHKEVLETYRMFAEDRGWLRRIGEAIRSGLSAEAAVQKVHEDMRSRLAHVSDPYLRERVHDLEDLSNRLLQHLAGDEQATQPPQLPEDAVLVGRRMGPAELLVYDRARLRALVLEEGSPTAHAAIVARAMGLPVVGRVGGILDMVEPGDPILVDASNAQVYLRPGEELRQTFGTSMQALQRRRAAYAALHNLPAETRDGVAVSLNMNAGLLMDVQNLAATGADGIGLFRTEIQFMTQAGFPGVEDQTRLYAEVLDQAQGKPVVFRTLDVGGDKALPYLDAPADENPAMGWRAIRVALDRPAMLRQQIRALVRAARGRTLNVMFPMISEVAEFQAARRLVALELERARARGEEVPRSVRTGVMLEVPALAWQLPSLLPSVDFLSVGSNDLLQFLFASDRGNPRLADRYDPLSPPVLAMLHQIAEAAGAARVPFALCGEIAGRSLEAMALIGLGFRSLSMPAPAIGPVKSMVRSLKVAPLRAYVQELPRLPDHSVREKLRAFAVDHGVLI